MIASRLGLDALELDAVARSIVSTPSSPPKKSKCHHERRNSPSVASLRPISSCFVMIFSISGSSTALSCGGMISPFARLARASLSGAVRNRLPTWSARNGGLDVASLLSRSLCLGLTAQSAVDAHDVEIEPGGMLPEHSALFALASIPGSFYDKSGGLTSQAKFIA